MSQPQVPPRPARSQAPQSTGITAAAAPAPTIPPRPARRDDRSESPSSHYPRSPLNESPFPLGHPNDLQRIASLNASRSNIDLPHRPPSVSFPSIGQEGSEYDAGSSQDEEAVDASEASPGASPTHTRKVSQDLPLHAPRPSLSSSEAKQRVAAVVRTDSNQAGVAASVPKPAAGSPSLKAKPSFQRPGSSASYERPGSAYGDEHGIPHFGQHVPLGSQYGDVQAPSPAPYGSQHGSQPNTPLTPGFGADSSRPSTGRHHNRKHSGRTSFQAPPGSYGLHGHGVQDTSDPFEKDWLQKHPDALREEIAAHSPAILDRHDYNLSAAELNKLVKQSRAPGFGASSHSSMPDEQIGYLVSEKYSSRGNTPGAENNRPPSINAPHVDSPLKSGSVTADDLSKLATLNAASHDGTIHVDAPAHRESKHLGRGQAAESEHVDLGSRGGNSEEASGWQHESGYGVPILASDELDPNGSYLQPAVPPISEGRRGSAQHDDYGHSRPSSRPSSRPGSIHNQPGLARVTSRNEHILEDVREYEPLFPEDDSTTKKSATPADRFKQRPDMKQRFPSQDIWEDAPPSVMMSTEVETPEPEDELPRTRQPAFETAEAERARKGEVSEQERAQLLPKEARLAQSKFQPHLKQEMRPGRGPQRFPSRDIWEDSPDSTYMTTTVGEEEETNLADEAGAVVSTSTTLPREGATAGAPAVALPEDNTTTDQPVVPPRPARAVSPNKVVPQIPARPARRPSPHAEKPSVPPRPAKVGQLSPDEAAAEAAAESTGSARSIDESASTKQKPMVPARMGSKIAALQAGFMSDLNKKLGLGPQGPPKKEEPQEEQAEEEKKPLEDARKSRARGPARRKPAASPSAAASDAPAAARSQPRSFTLTPVYNLYDIAPSGDLTATHADTWEEKLKFKDGFDAAAKEASAPKDVPISQAVPPAAGFNTAGEAVHPPTVTPEAVRSTALTEGAPAVASEAVIAGEPADTGHAGVASSLSSTSAIADESLTHSTSQSETTNQHEVKTGIQEPVGEGSQQPLTKQRTTSSSHGTQTGEMNITMDHGGNNPQKLTAYKNGSAHDEGYAFVKDETKEVSDSATQS